MGTRNDSVTNYSENIYRPGVIGRILRLLTGLLQVRFVISVVPEFNYYMTYYFPRDFMYWIAVIIAFLVLNPVINIGFNLKSSRRPQIIFLFLVAVSVLFNLWQFGAILEAPLNFLIFLMAIYVHIHLGMAHILSAILATPGCEMRAFSQIMTMITSKKTDFYVCPGFWTPLDKWEATLKNKYSPT